MPPRRMCPNSSSLSLALLSPPPSLAPSATTTMEKFTPRVRWRRMMCSQTRSMSMGFSGIRITSAPPGFLNGFVRLVPRIVPPRWRMPVVASRVSRKWSGGSIRPRQPSRTPITSRPCCSPRRTTARITALRPGQSPPPVRTAIFMAANLAGGRRDFKRSGVKVAPGDHLHRPEEEVFLGVRLPAARLPRRPLEPLPRHHLAVMRERRKQLRVGLRQVPPYERPQQRSQLPAGQEGVPAARVQPSVEFVRDVEQLVHQRLHPLLGRTGAEELRPQSDAVERALALERHARAGERLDRRTRSAPGFSGHEQDARRLDVRQLRQLPCHVRREAPAEQRRVGPCRSSGGHEWEPVRVRTLSWRW